MDDTNHMSTEGTRCTGHCCHGFTIPRFSSHGEVLEAAWYAVDYDVRPVGPHADAIGIAFKHRADKGNINQIRDIADMLVPLGRFSVDSPPVPYKPGHLAKLHGPGQTAEFYSCRHVTASGDCGIYARRPNMCRRYPYGNECCFSGCTQSGGCGVES